MLFLFVCFVHALHQLPPMGWMAWNVFHCNTDCSHNSTTCLNEQLFLQQAQHLKEDGYLEAGYTRVHIDDCWAAYGRDSEGKLFPAPDRFPHGIAWLAEQLHEMGVGLGIYGDIGSETCAKFPGTKGHEEIDAQTFADWKVDYVKMDGCNIKHTDFQAGYQAFGDALVKSGREIIYSCSWPAYLGDNETAKPYEAMVSAHCNLWRNWKDITSSWTRMNAIIEHFGQYSQYLSTVAGPGHWNDLDMLLLGREYTNQDLSLGETFDMAVTQFSIWCVMASPLMMGNDLRAVPDVERQILLNKRAIAVNQDLAAPGARIYVNPIGTEIWSRKLSDGSYGVVLYNQDFKHAVDIVINFNTHLGLPANTTMRVEGIFHAKDIDKVVGYYMGKGIAKYQCAFVRFYPL